MGVSALAVEFIRAGLRGFIVIDRSESSDRQRDATIAEDPGEAA
jgi:hypothetical protein